MRFKPLFIFLILTLLTTSSAQQTATSTNTTSAIISQYGNSFKNQGGSILHDKVNVYIIFYGNWSSTQLQQDQQTFMKFVDTISLSPWFKTLNQYSDSNGKSVTGPLNLAAAVNDAGSHSLNLTNSVHKQIVLDAVNSGYLSPVNRLDSEGIYIIMGGPDVNDSEFCSVNCGYNGYSDEFQYMFIGYPGVCPNTCIPTINKSQSPNNSPAIDAAITIFSHEIQDILTDPRNNAWEIQTSNITIELGDFCSSQGTSQEQFGNYTTSSSGSYNLELSDSKYLVQTIFDKVNQKCTLG
ncbi:phosphate-induced protein 1 [Gilbertella persicaria]|uniref:phosphate-induced protein 1 n=1 Tax=Gilbertella persicaria TaxID=101096 RepID=UPI002220D186|nr:phosphate-induced protein 1 [Gilbertella persicaria]KAI8054946.1 phosphate-induced protein 1 [Gilbertella persicaria]